MLWVAFIYLVAVGLCGYIDVSGAFDYLETYSDKWRLRIYRGAHVNEFAALRKKIVLVSLSTDSFSTRARQETEPQPIPGPPAPRGYHAKVINELARAGISLIAFDLVFDFPSNEEDDSKLAASARASKHVLWACAFDNVNTSEQQAILPLDFLRKASPYVGHIQVPQFAQHPMIKAIQPVIPYHEDTIDSAGRPVSRQGLMPAFSLAAAQLALHLQGQPLERAPGGWKLGTRFIPVDESGHYQLLFSEEKPTINPGEYFQETVVEDSNQADSGSFTVLRYEDICDYDRLSGKHLGDDPIYKQILKDRIAIVGDTSLVGNDHRHTTVGDMWGTEVEANAITTMLWGLQRGRFLVRAPLWLNLGVMLLAAALVVFAAARLRVIYGAMAAALVLIGYILCNFALFVGQDYVVHIVAPVAAMVMVALGVLTERGLTEEREKNRMHGLLQRYVSAQVAEFIVANPEKCVLGGERVTATVLFSDIRGFTAMSERLSPEEVLARLNEYLQSMTDVVFKQDGAVDKYIGDAIMALYGAPLRHADHALRAVTTAIEMQTALLQLQAHWQAQGLPLIDIGIGINTGDMVVGNMGSDQRMDFSVIGDAVNLASRVESLNKEMNSRILITAATYEYVKDLVRARGPLEATVKGKAEVCEVYEIYGWLNDASAPANSSAQKTGAKEIPREPAAASTE